MLAGGYSWRLFFYVEFAFGCALFILAFFVVEETLYHRVPRTEAALDSSSSQNGEKGSSEAHAVAAESSSDAVAYVPPRKTFLQTLKFWGAYDKDTEYFLMMARSFTYYLVPHVLWVVTTYGLSTPPPISRPTYFAVFTAY
jgi:hypothetical protein